MPLYSHVTKKKFHLETKAAGKEEIALMLMPLRFAE
jgi:hypothetical protein